MTLPDDDKVLRVGSDWTRVNGAGYYRGSALRTTHKGAKLTLPGIAATNLDLVATTCPTCGAIRVALVRHGEDEDTGVEPPTAVVIDLRSPRTKTRRLIDAFYDDSDPSVVGTLVIKVLTSGRPVIIDGILID